MTNMTPEQYRIWDRVTSALCAHIEPIFKKDVLITLLVRTPGQPDRDIVVTADTNEGIDEIVARAKPKKALHG